MYIQLHRLGLYALLMLLFFSCASTRQISNESVPDQFLTARERISCRLGSHSCQYQLAEQTGTFHRTTTTGSHRPARFFESSIISMRSYSRYGHRPMLYTRVHSSPGRIISVVYREKHPNHIMIHLQFWVEAAHERGLELHVWLNPYRAHHVSGGEVSDSSVVKKMPDLVVKLKEGYWWFDPSIKGTQDHGVAVVMDIVKRYDIDGVHFDDYFYPYPSYNGNEDFPDSTSWKQYMAGGGKLSRGDWRRESVNTFIHRLYKEIKAEKKHVKFGLSPFGTWRPGHPEGVVGFDQYDQLYADAKLWLNKGWIDYFSPQLYWPINRIPLSFPGVVGMVGE